MADKEVAREWLSARPDSETGVLSKDITISDHSKISARIHHPNLSQPENHGHQSCRKLPVLVYFHGGGFCIQSTFSFLDHRYLNRLVSESRVIVVSVEYRLAPESPLPAAYEDCWAAAHSGLEQELVKETWLVSHGDLGRLYIGGDSAGGNIVHNVALRGSTESLPGGVKLRGAFLAHPYFLGSKPIGSEPRGGGLTELTRTFDLGVCVPINPMMNPVSGNGAPSLAGLGCSRMLAI